MRFLVRPRWIALTLFTVLLSALCFRLAFWQLDRLEGRRAVNERFRAGMVMAPEPIESVLDKPGGTLISRQVTASGRYDLEAQTVLYGRPLQGRPGNHVLTPLILADGRAVIVDRGWVPFEPLFPPIAGSDPPSGSVLVTGLLAKDEAQHDSPVVAEEDDRITVVSRVDVEALAEQVPYELVPFHVVLRDQEPEQGDLPVPEPPAALTDGPHLGYALQWFAFGTIALVGWVILVRREARDQRASADAE